VCQSCPEGPGGDACIAIGDDSEQVLLYRFPAPFVGSEHHKYSGHSSHVTKVRFDRRNRLISIGGRDHTLQQWSIVDEVSQPLPNSCEQSLAKMGAAVRSNGIDSLEGAVGGTLEVDAARAAREVLETLGTHIPSASRRPPLAPRPSSGSSGQLCADGYAGFRGPFAGDEFVAVRPDLEASQPFVESDPLECISVDQELPNESRLESVSPQAMQAPCERQGNGLGQLEQRADALVMPSHLGGLSGRPRAPSAPPHARPAESEVSRPRSASRSLTPAAAQCQRLAVRRRR